MAGPARRRGRRHRQRPHVAVPAAGDDRRGRAPARRDHRGAGRLHRGRRVQAGPGGTPGGIPYLVVHGRRGGSAVTAAAVNGIANEVE
ncbi:precorrin-8X methylmutase [Micromonospora inyonensis]|uniref:precorrin-8X methylmutase n=1 Tax=Micromonospora inyonensis TaxID=47866 RepID=UPI003CCB7B42